MTPKSKKQSARDVKQSTPRNVSLSADSVMKVSRAVTARKPTGAVPSYSKTVTTGARRRPVSVSSNVSTRTESAVRKEVARRSAQPVAPKSNSIVAQLDDWEKHDQDGRTLSEMQRK